jgi:MFS family permease
MIASILGPTLGGFLTEHLDWSLIFWINLPLGALALVMSERALRQLPRHERRHKLDVLGALLLVAAALSLMLALAWGGTHYPWRSWQIIGLLAASVALWTMFVARLLTAREPFIPLTILGGRTTGAVTLAAFFSVGTIIGITIYTPLYCETVLGLSASRSGMTLISFMAGTVAGAQINMRLMLTMWVKHYLRLPLACLGLAIATLVTLAMLANPPSVAAFVGVLFVIGFAVGPMYPVSTILMQNSVKPHQLGTATGTLNFFRTLGGAIIVAVFGAIVLGVAANASQTTIEQLALNHGDMVPAFHFVFLTAAVFLAISFVALLFAEEHPLHGPVPLSPED